MNKREYKKWTDYDRDQLIALTKQNISSTGKIYWDVVSTHFQGRTMLQCKNYYQNIIRPTLQDNPVLNRVESQKQQVIDSNQSLEWSKSEGIRLSFLIILYGTDIEKLQVFFQNRSKQELSKFVEQSQFYLSYYKEQFAQLIDGSYYFKNVPQVEMRVLIGVMRVLEYRYLFLSLGPDDEIPKLPANLNFQVKQFLGTQISGLLSSRMDFVEESLYLKIEKEFGVQKVIDQLKVLEQHYRKRYGNNIFCQ
ncbi:Conserved_hypothetical protein [Hexamita inflata]|uniref:Myb-like domain-containing protein n=1 Tax=Hexamita inflata TaxID=28002 RepID=A0AA86N8S7_9EUKA|nr:Conserved hypothetical protein [Hexamita inflata]